MRSARDAESDLNRGGVVHIPGMPDGKPAGVRCIQLDAENRCLLFGKPERPAVCVGLQPSAEMCRESAAEAIAWLTWLEESTAP